MGWDGTAAVLPLLLPARPLRLSIHSPLISVSGGKLPILFPVQSNSNRLISPRFSVVSRLGPKPTYPRRRTATATTYLSRSRRASSSSLFLAPIRSLGKKVSGHPVCSFLGILGPSFPDENDQPTDEPFSGPRSCFLCSFILEKGKSEQ